MLFQRLYNWIKYKTLPPSFLFKNRLFIERDSKHKRILNNFGLVFRNSKWSNYETYNIKTNFKTVYARYFFFFFFISFFLYFFFNISTYYVFHYLFNSVSFLFWISLDSFDYYLSFGVWIINVFLTTFFNIFYSYFFFNHFSSKIEKNIPDKKENFNVNLSKSDLNWILYSWILNPLSLNSKNIKNFFIFENIFENNINQKWWNSYYFYFINLYKLTYFSNLINVFKNNNYFLIKNELFQVNNQKFSKIYSLFSYFDNNFIVSSHSSFLFWYFLNSKPNYFLIKNGKKNNRFEWNIYNFNSELQNYNMLLLSKYGSFYFDNLTQNIVNTFLYNHKEFFFLPFIMSNHSNFSKWNRWLYRYSILHRKLLKNSHKLTLTKRLINSGFYNNEIFNKNIWNSEHLSKYNEKNNLFNSFFNLYYLNFFKNKNSVTSDHKLTIMNNVFQNNSLSLLSFYENSYFWFLKRFYLFNTLPSNFIYSKPEIITLFNNNKNTIINNKNQVSLNHFLLLSYLLKSKFFSMPFLNFFNISNFNDFNINQKNFISNNNFFFNSIYLYSNDNDLLSKDNLKTLISITSSNFYISQNRSFFSYLFFSSSNVTSLDLNLSFSAASKLNAYKIKNFNSLLLLSIISNDSVYLNDLKHFSLFY